MHHESYSTVPHFSQPFLRSIAAVRGPVWPLTVRSPQPFGPAHMIICAKCHVMTFRRPRQPALSRLAYTTTPNDPVYPTGGPVVLRWYERPFGQEGQPPTTAQTRLTNNGTRLTATATGNAFSSLSSSSASVPSGGCTRTLLKISLYACAYRESTYGEFRLRWKGPVGRFLARQVELTPAPRGAGVMGKGV